MYIRNVSLLLLCLNIFHKLNAICLIRNKQFFLNTAKNNKSVFARSRQKKTSVKKNKFSNIPFRGSTPGLSLFDEIKKKFFFFPFMKSGEDEKFCEEIILNLSDITKIRQLTQKTQHKMLEKENVKKIFLHGIFSSINFKTLNSISYLLRRFNVERATICSVLNEVSEDVHEVKHAENFLALHFFLLKDEDVSLFSTMHIIDFFKSKQNVMEALHSIK
ncbi:conserved Plasmodium protein, unknown function, partial [Plasmodium ovale]